MTRTAAWLLGGATLAAIVAGIVALRAGRVLNSQPEVTELVGEAEPRAVDPGKAPPPIRRNPVAGAVLAAGRLPDSVDMVLVIDKAAELRTTPLGQGLATLLDADGSLKDVQDAWAGLAKQLGYTDREALDNLVGRRLVIASRTIPTDPPQQRWAVMSDVSRDTEARIKQRLLAAPRSIDAGHQILSIEQGRFELTSHRRPAALRDPGESPDTVTLIMGPAGRSELFDELVAALALGTARPLSATDALARAARAGQSEVLFLARLNAVAAPAQEPWSDFALLAGRRVGTGDAAARTWATRVLVRDSQRRRELDAVPPTSDAPFRALSEGSLLTLVQAAPLSAVLGPGSAMGSMLSQLPLPDRARQLASGRQLLSIRDVGGRDATPRLACTVAVETSSVGELAGLMDTAMSRAVQSAEKTLGSVAPPPRDFAGAIPRAARVVDIRVPDTSPLKAVTTEPVSLAWCYPSIEGGDTPASSAGVWGWWAMSLVQTRPAERPSAGEILLQQSRALLAEGTRTEIRRGEPSADAAVAEPGPAGWVSRWVLLASSRPAALEALMPPVIPDFRSIRTTLRRFEAIDARLNITDEGDVQGDITLKLAAEATTPQAPAKAADKP